MMEERNWLVLIIAAAIGIGLFYALLRLVGFLFDKPWIIVLIVIAAGAYYYYTRKY